MFFNIFVKDQQGRIYIYDYIYMLPVPACATGVTTTSIPEYPDPTRTDPRHFETLLTREKPC